MSPAPEEELAKLREAVESGASHIERQLQQIGKGLFLGSLASIVVAVGVSVVLQILVYWVPASFVLLYLAGLYGFISERDSFSVEGYRSNVKRYTEVSGREAKLFEVGVDVAFKNMRPLVKAISLTYFITLSVLLLAQTKIITSPDTVLSSITLVVPAVTALFLILLPYFVNRFAGLIEDKDWEEIKQSISNLVESDNTNAQIFLRIIIAFLSVSYVLAVIIAPFASILVTWPLVESVWILILVVVLQMTVILVLTSYLSARTAKRELLNSLAGLEEVNQLINRVRLENDVDKEEVESLKERYYGIEEYIVRVDNWLKIVDFYLILPYKKIINEFYPKE